MNKVDKGLLTVLILAMAALFICWDEVKQIKKEHQARITCERLGMKFHASHHDVKTNIIKIECEVA